MNRMADNPESDWIVVPNCHEALVPMDLWRKAQAIREARKQKGANTGFRRGRGKVSPYLLSGIVECAGCGHKFHGHKITKGKSKKNGEKVVTNYYVCGGYMMAGNSICRRDLIRREALDNFIIDRVRLKLVPFLENGGDKLLRKFLQEELNSTQPDPKAEMRKIRKRIQEISEKADVLLENLTPSNRDFVDEKLAKLKRERHHLEEMLEEQEKIMPAPITCSWPWSRATRPVCGSTRNSDFSRSRDFARSSSPTLDSLGSAVLNGTDSARGRRTRR